VSGLTFLRGGLEDKRVGLFNEVQLLSHVAGGEWVVTCDHDHLRGRGVEAGQGGSGGADTPSWTPGLYSSF
jgi:hypothetical protein